MDLYPCYQHKQNKQIYTILLTTNEGATDQAKFPVTVVYRNAMGRVYSRRLDDFLEKMEPFEPRKADLQNEARALITRAFDLGRSCETISNRRGVTEHLNALRNEAAQLVKELCE